MFGLSNLVDNLKKKENESSVTEKRKKVLAGLENFGTKLYDQMEEGIFPWLAQGGVSVPVAIPVYNPKHGFGRLTQ